MEMLTMGLGLLCVFIFYFLPSIVGNDKKKKEGIQILNLFLGWTFIGWVVALIWAVSDEKDVRKEILK